MTAIKEIFTFKELKNINTLVVCSLMVGLNVILSVFLEIPLVPNTIMIGFHYLVLVLVGYMYGAMPAMIVGGLGDIIGAILFPKGPFFIGFTLNAMFEGFIYGVFFYKKKISLKRVVGASIVNLIIVSLIMTPTWIYIMYSTNILLTKTVYIAKIGKLPIDILMTYLFLKRITRFVDTRK